MHYSIHRLNLALREIGERYVSDILYGKDDTKRKLVEDQFLEFRKRTKSWQTLELIAHNHSALTMSLVPTLVKDISTEREIQERLLG